MTLPRCNIVIKTTIYLSYLYWIPGGNPKKLNELVDKLKESPSTNSNQSVDDKILEDKKAINIENSDNYKNLIAQGKSVVHFNAIWCIPSQVFKINPNQSLKIKRWFFFQVMEPIFESLANEHTNIKFLKVDIDKMGEQLEVLLKEINTVPTFHFYVNNILTDMLSGANPSILKNKVQKLNLTQDKEVKPMIMYEDSLSSGESGQDEDEIKKKLKETTV